MYIHNNMLNIIYSADRLASRTDAINIITAYNCTLMIFWCKYKHYLSSTAFGNNNQFRQNLTI